MEQQRKDLEAKRKAQEDEASPCPPDPAGALLLAASRPDTSFVQTIEMDLIGAEPEARMRTRCRRSVPSQVRLGDQKFAEMQARLERLAAVHTTAPASRAARQPPAPDAAAAATEAGRPPRPRKASKVGAAEVPAADAEPLEVPETEGPRSGRGRSTRGKKVRRSNLIPADFSPRLGW